MNERSSFALDWKLALFGAVVLMGLVATTVTAALEGLPWVTKEEMNYRDQVWDAKMQGLLNAQSTTNGQISAINSQQSASNSQMTALDVAEKADRRDIDILMTQKRQLNSLEKKYRQSREARTLDRQHYERELNRMEKDAVHELEFRQGD